MLQPKMAKLRCAVANDNEFQLGMKVEVLQMAGIEVVFKGING
jgi:hypothetical protein